MRLEHIFGKVYLANITGVLGMCQKLREEGSYLGFTAEDIGVVTVCEDWMVDKCREEFGIGMEVMPPTVLYIRAGLNDGHEDHSLPYGPPNEVFRYVHAVKSIEFVSQLKSMVVVHCLSGVSRSSFVVALYIAWQLGGDIESALTMLKAVYSHTNPHPKHAVEAKAVLDALRQP